MAEQLPAFVARRRPDWDALHALLHRHAEGQLRLDDLQQLDLLYRRASADLAFAQAFYPSTDAHRFLNQLCASAYGAIYRPVADRWAATRAFFLHTFPRAVRAESRFVAVSAALFALGLILGAAVVLFEPRGADLLVPPGVRAAIAARSMWTDDLLAVIPPSAVSSAILTNNLMVTIAAFALGATLGLGTVSLLIFNGVQIGAISALCIREGMGLPLLGFIGAHGAVELSIVVLAGAGGLMVGQALIDPGELPRRTQAPRRALAGARLVVGCAPFLALTGIVEGFISPGTLFPAPLKVGLGLVLGGLFWAYLFLAGRER